MTTNHFFNNFTASNEQQLIENLIVESIKISGMDFYYLPRSPRLEDKLYGEDASPAFINAFLIEMYIKSFSAFEGEGDLFSKFGLTIYDQLSVSVARRRFDDEIGFVLNLPRPLEGDLVWFPLNKKLFEVKYVEQEEIFYQLGALQYFTLKLELMEYHNQFISCGVAEIDSLYQGLTTDDVAFTLLTEDHLSYITTEDERPITTEHNIDDQNFQNTDANIIQIEANNFIDFDEKDPFSSGNF